MGKRKGVTEREGRRSEKTERVALVLPTARLPPDPEALRLMVGDQHRSPGGVTTEQLPGQSLLVRPRVGKDDRKVVRRQSQLRVRRSLIGGEPGILRPGAGASRT